MAIAEPLAVSFSTSFSYVHPAIYIFVEQYTAQPFILLHFSSFRRPSIQRSIYGALHEPAHGVNGQLCRPCVHQPLNLPSLTVLSLLAAAREEALGNEVLGRSSALFRLFWICCRFGVHLCRGWGLAAGCSGLLSRGWGIADLLRWGSSLSAGCRDEMLSAGFFGGGTVGAGLWMLCYKCNFRIRVRKTKNICGFVVKS